jgi:site-specific DNA-methyltransferase (adenine-specific)
MLDEQSGLMRARGNVTQKDHGSDYNASSYQFGGRESGFGGDSGGASRFFYIAKASTSEKNAGLDHAPQKVNDGRQTAIDNPFQRGETLRRNTHPTVKPIKLMRYLCRLITPKGATVLDPFLGSGTTGIAAIAEGFDFIGIEKEEQYMQIAEKRVQI